MKKIILIMLITPLVMMGLISLVHGETVMASQAELLSRYDQSDRMYEWVQIDSFISYFHQRRIGEATVEKDFIRYIFDVNTGELIEQTTQWREGLPEQVSPVIARAQVESMVEGVVDTIRLYFISPDTDVYPITPRPTAPCWIVTSRNEDRLIITIFDAMTGEKLGHGISPPSAGLSLTGPGVDDINDCSDPWTAWYENARDWFETFGYPTTALEYPRTATIQSYIQSDEMAVFYEQAHGGSWRFRNWCPEYTTAGDIETWLDGFASVPFAFIASCDGLCDTSDNNLSYEFRKGSNKGAVTVGYCHMAGPSCGLPCYEYSLDWQNTMFNWMANGNTVLTGFNQANLAYPTCASGNCMRIAGDTSVRLVSPLIRSLCGDVYDGDLGPLMWRPCRDYYIRCWITVPSGETLTIDPHVGVAFMNSSKITSHGTLNANGSTAQIRFYADEDTSKGMEFTGQIRIRNGGQIKIYE
ncbi:hypothetical protein ACFL0G_05540 [Candidatus Zixiibacteriota bacterium]